MLSARTRLSLCQYLALQDSASLSVLFEKHGAPMPDLDYFSNRIEGLRPVMFEMPDEKLRDILDEILQTQGDLRYRISPKYRYDERWADFVRCLELDGYRVESHQVVPVDPTIEAAPPIDDDLSAEVQRSGLSDASEILRLIEASASAFRQTPPNYNACLSNARVALETLARAIARHRKAQHPGSFDETKWGQVLVYLRTSGFITVNEEQGIAGAYGFISPGAHTPVGLTEEEMVRLGRSLMAAVSYLLIKRHNAS